MKKLIFLSLILTFFCSVNASVTELLGSRIWTSVDGKEVDAELVGSTARFIEIKRKSDRRKFKLPIDNLSKKDRELLSNAKENLLIAAKEWGDENSSPIVLDPSALELARRLGVIEKMGPVMRRSWTGNLMNFPVENFVLAGGGAKGGAGANTKRYIIKSGSIYLRISHAKSISGKDTRLQQKGRALWLYKQKYEREYSSSSSTYKKRKAGWEPLKQVAVIGGNVDVAFDRGGTSRSYLEDGGSLSFDRFSVERVKLWDAVVIDVSIKL